MTAEDPKAEIREQALALGFDAVGFAPADLGGVAADRLRRFLAEGLQGDMGWLAERSEQRGEPQALWPEARSVIVLAQNYGPEEDPLATLEEPEQATVSVYARNRDYHDLIKKRLKRLARWLIAEQGGEVKVFVDTAPVMEKPLDKKGNARGLRIIKNSFPKASIAILNVHKQQKRCLSHQFHRNISLYCT